MSRRRSFAVIGLGRFGSAMATTLHDLGHDVIGLDRDPEIVQRLANRGIHALELDITNEEALKAAGVRSADVAVVSIGENVEASLLVVVILKDLGVASIVAKAATPLHGRILEKLGVTRVVFPERDMAIRVAHSLVVPNLLDYVELSRDYSIVELPAPADFAGRSLKDLQLRPRFGLTLVAIRRATGTGDGEITNVAPGPDDVVQAGDILALLGSNDRLAQLDSLLKSAPRK